VCGAGRLTVWRTAAYQGEIDRLTRRSKAAEGAFLDAYKALAETPDPAPLLAAALVRPSVPGLYETTVVPRTDRRDGVVAGRRRAREYRSSRCYAQRTAGCERKWTLSRATMWTHAARAPLSRG
jgi:hypothetical protein